MGRISRIFRCLLLVALFALTAVTIHLMTTDAEFSRYNLGWNGTSTFFFHASDREVPEIYDDTDLQYHHCTVLLLIAPRVGIDTATIRTYRAFLENGHTLLLADDFNSGGEICNALNTSIRFLSGNLSSIDRGMATSSAVIARGNGGEMVFGNVSSLLLNRPSPLEGGETLMATSVLSWIDTDGNGRVDGGEVLRRYPVMVRDRIGKGDLIVVSDASLFINAMSDIAPRYDNEKFLTTLLTTQGLCLDQMGSRTGEGGILAKSYAMVKHTYITRLTLLAIVLFALAFAWRRDAR